MFIHVAAGICKDESFWSECEYVDENVRRYANDDFINPISPPYLYTRARGILY